MNLTAEEFLRDKLVNFKVDTQGVRPDWDTVAEWMNEYAILKAKHYVPLALEAAIPEFREQRKTKPSVSISLSIEGFPAPIGGDDFQEFIFGKIIPMWTLENFE